MKPLGWTLFQYDWCPYKRENLNRETDIHRGKTMWRHKGRRWPCDWSDASTSQKMPRIVSKLETRKSKEGLSPRAVRKRMTLLMPWFGTSSLQICETLKFYCFNPLDFWYFDFCCSPRKFIGYKQIPFLPPSPPNPVLFSVLHPTGRAQNHHCFVFDSFYIQLINKFCQLYLQNIDTSQQLLTSPPPVLTPLSKPSSCPGWMTGSFLTSLPAMALSPAVLVSTEQPQRSYQDVNQVTSLLQIHIPEASLIPGLRSVCQPLWISYWGFWPLYDQLCQSP